MTFSKPNSDDFSKPLSDYVTKEWIPPYAIFTDTETREDKETGKLTLELGCYEIWHVDTRTGLPIVKAKAGTYYTESEFYFLLEDYLPCRVLAHNWRFDAAILRIGSQANMDKWGYSISPTESIAPPHRAQYAPFLYTLDFGNDDYAQLLCNTNFYKMSLADIGESIGYSKLSMPDIDDTQELETYCQRDTEILRIAYFMLFEFSNEIGDTTCGITAAMMSNRIFRNAYYRRNNPVRGTRHIQRVHMAEREAYKGGRTDTFYNGQPIGVETMYKYDANSLYPSCMLDDIPVRYSQLISPRFFDSALERTDRIILCDLVVNIPDSGLGWLGWEGVRHEDKLIFPSGRFRVWAWQPMVEIAHEMGWIESVKAIMSYETEPLFRDYILAMYQRRLEYKASGNKAYDTLTKLCMNSLYGKFGQRENLHWEYVERDSHEYQVMYRTESWYDGIDDTYSDRYADIYDGVEETEYWIIGDDLYKHRGEATDLSAHSVCSIAGYITAKGRSRLWRAMANQLLGGGSVYMCDTDSVVTDTPMTGELVGDGLGEWKLEETAVGVDTRFVAPKHYLFGDRWKIKGIRNPSSASEFPQAVFPNFQTDILSRNPDRRKRLSEGAVMGYIVRKPSSKNEKRIDAGEGCFNNPIMLSL